MPYPAGHSAEVRSKIVASARKLFNQYGFDNVSLDRIMSGVGLTRGGFYNYSKAGATSTPRFSHASSPTPTGRIRGTESTSISRQISGRR